MSSSRMPAMWFLTEALFLVTMSLVCAVAMAQSTGDPARGSTPPGMSHDGAKPSDGAIKGGTSIAPGETGGLPNRTPSQSAEHIKRCDELTGSLCEECLKDKSGATGGTATPRTPTDILKKP